MADHEALEQASGETIDESPVGNQNCFARERKRWRLTGMVSAWMIAGFLRRASGTGRPTDRRGEAVRECFLMGSQRDRMAQALGGQE